MIREAMEPPAATSAGMVGVVKRMRNDGAHPERMEPSPTMRAGRAILWVCALAVIGLGLAPVVRAIALTFNDYAILNADDETARRILAAGAPERASADYYEALSELAMRLEPQNVDLAYLAAQRAVSVDPKRPYVWASLAYLETLRAGEAGTEAVSALTRSMELCALCSEDLVRWRLNFVLANWGETPDAVRREAFRHADMLRWRGENAEFLAEMRAKADAANIPFDAYRAAVDTPARGWDIDTVEGASP